MQSELPENDPKSIWQNQPTEPSVMTLETIRQKVRDLRAKTRKQLLGNLAVLVFVVACYGFGAKQFPAFRALFLLPIVWSLAGLYFLNRGMWSAEMPGDAALRTGLQFYREEMERRRALFRRTLVWGFGPIVLAIGVFLVAIAKLGAQRGGLFPNAIPFMSLVVIWIVAYFFIRAKEQRQLQREIDELNDIEKGNGVAL